ncbi:AMP-binding protein [Rhodococcus sp. ACPA1]|uniref:AMP-binding protein n=1 Tax=Rhodococcus sp. ACPA1 TaxID=2028572 RepID=UPI00211CFBCD|nr:AMP-binding protein [Rhodococcus sp. ACPA1]
MTRPPTRSGRSAVACELVERWYREGYYSHRTWVDVLFEDSVGSDAPIVYAAADGTRTVTSIGEIRQSAKRVAAALLALGVGRGDTVAVQLPNRVEASVAYAAVLLAGAILVPIVHIYGPNEVRFILEQSEAKVLIQPDRWRKTDYRDRIDNYVELSSLRHVVIVGDGAPAGTLSWDGLSTSEEYVRPAVHADDIALLIYTSGTTAAPKGVQHSHNSLLAEVRSAPGASGGRADSVQLVSFPPGHIAGVSSVLRPLVHGRSAVYMESWDPALAAELISQYRVTATSGTPFHLTGLMDVDHVADKLATLSDFLIGAATVPEGLVRRAAQAGISTFRCYGSTEHPTATSGRAGETEAERLGTDGAPMAGVRVRILDDRGADVPVGVDGEVILQGPDQFAGYRDAALDVNTFTDDGWMRTGDLGHLDAAGRLTITDRIKDVVIRAGETISSGQVEDVLAAHPAVVEGAVVAAPDARYGEVVAAVVVVEPGARLGLDELRVHFEKSGLARQKAPERLVVVDELPRTALGKVRKADLRAAHFRAG